MLEIVLLYAILAAVFPVGKSALTYSAPFFLTGIRMLLGGSVLLFWYYLRPSGTKSITRAHVLPLIALSIFNIYLTNVCEFWGLQYVQSAKACFMYNLSPFFSALLSYLLFGERMTTQKWLGMGIAFIGFLPILWHQTPAEMGIGGMLGISWADLSLITAALATVYGWIVMRTLVLDGVSPRLCNAISMLVGGVMALLTSVVAESWTPVPINNMSMFIALLLLLTLLSNILGYELYGVLLKRYTATLLSFAGFLSPLFAAIYGFILLHEQLTWHFYASCVCVLIGLYLFYRQELQQGYIKTI